MLTRLFQEMIRYDAGSPQRIQHFGKVHAFAKLIGELEGLDPEVLRTLEAAAYVHDIGIKPAEEKYGSRDGKLQEREGPPEARKLLERLGFEEPLVQRVCFLVGRHHTYTGIDGPDYQILVEADFLVNLYEKGAGPEAVRAACERIFRTPGGKRICREMFQIEQTSTEEIRR